MNVFNQPTDAITAKRLQSLKFTTFKLLNSKNVKVGGDGRIDRNVVC